MKKKGFVFIETIIVLMLITMSLTLLLASYTLIKTKSLEKEYYDKISDKYFLYSISNLGTSSEYNYSIIADEKLYLNVTPDDCSNYQSSMYKLNSNGTKTDKIDCSLSTNKDKNECMFFKMYSYSSSQGNTHNVSINTSSYDKVIDNVPNCQTVFDELDIAHLYVIPDVNAALSSPTATQTYDNGTINYLKTLRKCYDDVYVKDEDGDKVVSDTVGTCNNPVRYLVGVFYRYGNYYFASIEI